MKKKKKNYHVKSESEQKRNHLLGDSNEEARSALPEISLIETNSFSVAVGRLRENKTKNVRDFFLSRGSK